MSFSLVLRFHRNGVVTAPGRVVYVPSARAAMAPKDPLVRVGWAWPGEIVAAEAAQGTPPVPARSPFGTSHTPEQSRDRCRPPLRAAVRQLGGRRRPGLHAAELRGGRGPRRRSRRGTRRTQ